MMEWFSIKDRIPEDGQRVLIMLNYHCLFIFQAVFYKQIDCIEDNYTNTFFICAHPRFPKHWAMSEEWIKISRIHKSKVKAWCHNEFPT